MDIIKKLGYKNWEWEQTEAVETSLDVFIRDEDERGIAWSYTQKNAMLIAISPEMLEVLIAIEACEQLSMDAQLEIQEVCEKATGKTWEEIKELINE